MKREHAHNLSKTDIKLVESLRKDCRRSYREIAREISMSPSAVMGKMKRLEESGVIKAYIASLDLQKLGYEFIGLVNINIEPGHLSEAQEKVGRLDGVYAVYDVTGEYDAVAFVIARDRAGFSTLIKAIGAVPYIRRTNTNMVLKVVKDPTLFSDF